MFSIDVKKYFLFIHLTLIKQISSEAKFPSALELSFDIFTIIFLAVLPRKKTPLAKLEKFVHQYRRYIPK